MRLVIDDDVPHAVLGQSLKVNTPTTAYLHRLYEAIEVLRLRGRQIEIERNGLYQAITFYTGTVHSIGIGLELQDHEFQFEWPRHF